MGEQGEKKIQKDWYNRAASLQTRYFSTPADRNVPSANDPGEVATQHPFLHHCTPCQQGPQHRDFSSPLTLVDPEQQRLERAERSCLQGILPCLLQLPICVSLFWLLHFSAHYLCFHPCSSFHLISLFTQKLSKQCSLLDFPKDMVIKIQHR